MAGVEAEKPGEEGRGADEERRRRRRKRSEGEAQKAGGKGVELGEAVMGSFSSWMRLSRMWSRDAFLLPTSLTFV